MQTEADMIIELWIKLRPYISPKERLDAADELVAVFDEFGMTDGLEHIVNDIDPQLSAAIRARFEIDTEDDDYEREY